MDGRTVIVVGNGLGMAVDATYFNLEAGLRAGWNSSKQLCEEHKALIKELLPPGKEHPTQEEDLEALQLALFAVETLQGVASRNVGGWLNGEAAKMPQAFKRYIHEVGMYFHKYDLDTTTQKAQFDWFIEKLAVFLKDTKSHIATLNYDNLLYDSLIREGVLDGSKYLVDGYVPQFDSSVLDKRGVGWFFICMARLCLLTVKSCGEKSVQLMNRAKNVI